MRIIAITTPTVTDEDIYLIKGLVDNGIDTINPMPTLTNVEDYWPN